MNAGYGVVAEYVDTDLADAAKVEALLRSKKNSEIFIDENGQVWVDGELGDELAEEVVNAGYGVVAEYVDTDLADAAKVEALLRSLPMGEYASDVDVTKGVDVLSLAYREVPETLEGDSVDAAEEVVNAGYGVVAEYVDTDLADAAKVEALLRSLPMGEYASDVDVTKGVDVLSLAYREVPETLEGDSVDAALAYDVTAVFCAMPLVNEIQITLAESDEPLDESYYVFKRDEVQSRYGVLAYDVTAVFCAMPLVNEIQITLAESDEPLDESYYVFKRDEVQSRYGVRLDDLLVNEAGWHQIKEDNLYRRKFIENMVDAAEKEWK